MSLPKITIPKFHTILPSSGKEVVYRPFLVKEEKAMLIAVESKDQKTMIRTIKDSISACVEDVDVSKLPFFDLEYLFLNLRAKSVKEEVSLRYRHRNGLNRQNQPCDKATEITINLESVGVVRNETHKDKFMIDDQYGVKLKYPTIDQIEQLAGDQKDELLLMAKCIEYVYDNDNVYEPDNIAEAVKFIEGMNTKQFQKFSEFFETMPKLSHTVTYKCEGCGQEDTVKLEGVADFF